MFEDRVAISSPIAFDSRHDEVADAVDGVGEFIQKLGTTGKHGVSEGQKLGCFQGFGSFEFLQAFSFFFFLAFTGTALFFFFAAGRLLRQRRQEEMGVQGEKWGGKAINGVKGAQNGAQQEIKWSHRVKKKKVAGYKVGSVVHKMGSGRVKNGVAA